MDIYTSDIKSAYPKEMRPRWWQFVEKERIRKRLRKETDEKLADARHLALVEALTEALRNTQISGNHTLHHTYAQRPPAPRPSRMMIIYVMQDGKEIREFVPLNGQAIHYSLSPMHYVWNQEQPPSHIRYEFGYTDGSPW